MNDIRYYLTLFLRRLPAFLLVAAVVSAVSVIVAVSLPPAYVARTRLFVEASQIPDELAPSTVRVPGLERLQLIEQRLLTRANMLDIANKLIVLKDQKDMSPDEIVEAMMARTVVRKSTGRDQASIMDIAFEARTGRLAAEVLNQYLELIQQNDVTFRKSRATGTMDFFEIEVARLDAALKEQSNKILQFKNANVNALPDSLDFRQTQRDSAQQRLESAEREIFELNSQRRQLINLFEDAMKGGSTGIPQTPNQEALQAAKAELSSALLIYSDTHPKVKLLQSRVDQLTKATEAEIAPPSESDIPAETGNPALNLRLAEIDTRIENLNRQLSSSQARIDELTQSIEQTPTNAIALDEMQREFDNLQQQYNTAVGRLSQASAGERIEVLSRGERLTILEQPAAPDKPTKPNRLKIAGAGTMLGIGMGAVLVFLIEFLNRAPRRPEDIIKKLDIWPLAAIPYTRTRREMLFQRGRKLLLIFIILVGGPIAVWSVHQYYLPLDLLAEKVMNKFGLRW